VVTRIKNQRGQLAVEMVLLLALTVAIFMAVSSIFRQKEILAMFVAKPWSNIASMIQNGVWQPGQLHPNSSERFASVRGDPP
jgi:hypothetical protein